MKTVKAVVKKILAWSYSRWRDYEECPLKAKLKHVEKIREPENAAMENGTIVHKLGEQYVTGQLKAMPKEFNKAKDTLVQLRKEKAEAESEWAFTKDWKPCAWFAKDAWVRIKVDAHSVFGEKKGRLTVQTCRVVDYKTGKEHEEHVYQRSLYAVGAFIMYPDVDTVIATHVYVDTGVPRATEYKRSQLETMKKQWEQRTRAMMNDTRFAPRPGRYCRWCFFSKSKGGTCPF